MHSPCNHSFFHLYHLCDTKEQAPSPDAVSWQIISSIQQEEGRGNEAHAASIRAYRSKIEAKLARICDGDPAPVVDEGRLPQV